MMRLIIQSILLLLFSFSTYSQALTNIQPFLGTWKLLSVIREDLVTSEKVNDLGSNPQGYLNYSADGRMMVIIVSGERKKPLSQVRTAAEEIALFKSMNSYAGSYTIQGKQIIHHIDISWNQSWTGTHQTRDYRFMGNKLILSLAPTTNPKTGHQEVLSLT